LLLTFSTGMQATSLSKDYTDATLQAESKLATIGVGTSDQHGVKEGKFNRKYPWRTTISPYQAPVNENRLGEGFNTPMNLPAILYQVKVEVFWTTGGKRRTVVLKTLRLASQSP